MSHKSKILKLLVKHVRVANFDLNQLCYRYSARIMDLRRSGFDIEAKRDSSRNGVWWFELTTPHNLIDWDKMKVKQ